MVLVSHSIWEYFFYSPIDNSNRQGNMYSVMAVINLLPVNLKFIFCCLIYKNATGPLNILPLAVDILSFIGRGHWRDILRGRGSLVPQ